MMRILLFTILIIGSGLIALMAQTQRPAFDVASWPC